MNKGLTRLVLVASTALTIITPAQAQEAAASSSDAGDIIVTARRSEERLQDVPISITVFNQEQLNERNVLSANDLAIYTPSLTSNSRYGEETASFALRGFTQEGFTSPSVAVYFADVVAPRANGGTSGGNGAGVGAFFDLQNVQVLKGPQGTLFGRNTTGGAILLVPAKPTDQFEGYVEASMGNYDMRRLQGVINAPLAEGVRLRVGADYQARDGYLKNHSGIGPDDFADVNYFAGRASLVVDITPELENYTIASYSRSHTNGSVPKIVLAKTNTVGGVPCQPAAGGGAGLLAPLACQQILRREARGDGYYDVENSNPDANFRLKQWSVINTTTLTASDSITIKNIASYAQVQQAQSSAIMGDNFTVPAAFGPLAGRPFSYVGLYTDPDLGNNISQWTFTEELQLQGHMGDKLSYQGGAYYEQSGPLGGYQGTYSNIFISCTDVLALQCINPGTGGFVQNSMTKYKFKNIGFYGQGTYKFTEQLSLTAGLRYTIDKTTGTGATRTFTFPTPNTPVAVCPNDPTVTDAATNPDACAQSLTQKSKKPTWLIGLDYKPNDDILLFAKYARGYRQGGLNVSNTIPNAWGPEKVDNYEIGAKLSFHGGMPGFFNIAAFRADFSNQQLQASLIPCQSASPPIPAADCPGGLNPLASPAATIVNAGTSRIQGIEVDAQVSPLEGLRFNIGYAYLDAKLKEASGATIIDGYAPVVPNALAEGAAPLPSTAIPAKYIGDLTYAPRHKVTLTGAYTLPLDESVGKVTFSATYTYTAPQLVISTSPLGVLPATNLWNLNVSWKSVAGSPLDLAFFATNLTNKKYPATIGSSYQSTGYETYILGAPRMFGFRAKVRFGGAAD